LFPNSTNLCAPRISVLTHGPPVESYKAGYPRFSALIAAHVPYLICRRFMNLRARLLLLKQDRLSVLEQRLDEIDKEEVNILFLGKSRWDGNADRLSVLSEIESAMADYGIILNSRH
jgi:hypothetical protein